MCLEIWLMQFTCQNCFVFFFALALECIVSSSFYLYEFISVPWANFVFGFVHFDKRKPLHLQE